jgi:hypothetical protein
MARSGRHYIYSLVSPTDVQVGSVPTFHVQYNVHTGTLITGYIG